ncbi:MAG TPA: sulfatase, partial [Verrucomicrobiaceae bacterium]
LRIDYQQQPPPAFRSPVPMIRPALLACLLLCGSPLFVVAATKPNVLIITTDDMSCDSVGVFGCKLPDTTPNMDRLSTQCMRFTQAHTVVGNCMPSRNVMWSGRYPHNTGVEGFYQVPEAKFPVMCDLMKAAGYFTAIRHKVSHSTPYSPYAWDMDLDTASDGSKPHVKDPVTYRASFDQALKGARDAKKPFCTLLNIADPHKPFYAEGKGGAIVEDKHVPSKVFTPAEVPVPGFLPDDPKIRQELSLYYSSVRRADDAVGQILEGLKASGEADHTMIIFLSDHGMPLPFAKTQLYFHSTHTPLMIYWPGVTQPGSVDETHMVSTVDLLPTLLDMIGAEHPPGFDGRSFAPLLKGEKQDGWDMVFKEHNENAGGQRTPMRAVETKDYLYVFSPWSNGTRVMGGATAGTVTCKTMRVLAKNDAQIAARVDLFDHRVPEETYEVRYDPDALTNLIHSPAHAAQVNELEKVMEDWMVRTRDPLLEVFRHRDDPAYREAFMKQTEKDALAHSKRRRSENDEGGDNPKPQRKGKAMAKAKAKADAPPKGAKPAAELRNDLIKLELPGAIVPGQKAVVKVIHTLPEDLGEKPIQVTLKGANNERIERKTIKAAGNGTIEVEFDIPAKTTGKVYFAGLVGDNINDALQHMQTKALNVSNP